MAIFDSRDSRRWALAIALCVSTQARADPVGFGGGDGSSEKNAVVILGATNETEGIRAEHVWQARIHPRWRWTDQAVFAREGRKFDIIKLRGPDGPHELWFDVTAFFGRS